MGAQVQGILQSAFVLCNKSQNLHRHIMDHNSEFSFRDSLLQKCGDDSGHGFNGVLVVALPPVGTHKAVLRAPKKLDKKQEQELVK